MTKIGLGTVQWGLDYGISNNGGITPASEVKKILKRAKELGICVLDTAPTYGSAESKIGENKNLNSFRIISKTIHFNHNESIQDFTNSLHASIQILGGKQLYGVLFHRPKILLDPNGMERWAVLESFKLRGLIKKIGVSIYTGDEILKLFPKYTIDVIQVPLNVFDQRLIKQGHLKKLKDGGVEIHARSIFLQGLLLMTPERWPKYFLPFLKKLRAWHTLLKEQNVTALEAATSFVVSQSEVDIALFGVSNVKQLEEIKAASLTTIDNNIFRKLASDDASLINPSNWGL